MTNKKAHLIYLLQFASGRCYIGKTNNLDRRLATHAKSRTTLPGLAWRQHGAPEIEILHRCVLRAEAFILEAWEIHNRNTRSPNGYNILPGAEGRTVDQVRAWVHHCDFPKLSPAVRKAWEWYTSRQD